MPLVSCKTVSKSELCFKIISLSILMFLFYFMLLINWYFPSVYVKMVWIILPLPEESFTTFNVLRRTARNPLLWYLTGAVFIRFFGGWWCHNAAVMSSHRSHDLHSTCWYHAYENSCQNKNGSPPFPPQDMLPPLSCHVPMTINLNGFHVYLFSYSKRRPSC